jgi:hypothetical protein
MNNNVRILPVLTVLDLVIFTRISFRDSLAERQSRLCPGSSNSSGEEKYSNVFRECRGSRRYYFPASSAAIVSGTSTVPIF